MAVGGKAQGRAVYASQFGRNTQATMDAMTMHTTFRIGLAVLALGGLPGCKAVGELAYDINAQQQENECQRLRSQTEVSACLARTRTAEAQAQATRKAAAQDSGPAPSKPRPAGDLCFTRSTGERVCPN